MVTLCPANLIATFASLALCINSAKNLIGSGVQLILKLRINNFQIFRLYTDLLWTAITFKIFFAKFIS